MAKKSRKNTKKPNTDDIKPHASPKLAALCKWEHVDEVNRMLDKGDSPAKVQKYIVSNGFKISPPMVYEYAKLRRKCLAEDVTMEYMVCAASMNPVIDRSSEETRQAKEALRSDLDALDTLIQGGYKTLLEWDDKPVPPRLMMDAIKLKYDLTDGNVGFLTNNGMEHLRDIENAKYQMLINYLMSYVPEALQDKAVADMAEMEDSYYRGTPYYREYLRARGDMSDEDIERHIATIGYDASTAGA